LISTAFNCKIDRTAVGTRGGGSGGGGAAAAALSTTPVRRSRGPIVAIVLCGHTQRGVIVDRRGVWQQAGAHYCGDVDVVNQQYIPEFV